MDTVLSMFGNRSPMTWRRFSRKVRPAGGLLQRLSSFERCVLVSGCQRSGTTLVAGIVNRHPAFMDYSAVHSKQELAGALILAGKAEVDNRIGRYCFQTTYLNEHYPEYFRSGDRFRLIWVVRNPFSVVWSMAYHWRTFALNEVFAGCGIQDLPPQAATLVDMIGPWTLPKVVRACYAYNGKARQLEEIAGRLGERLLIIDYDQLVNSPKSVLPALFEFIGERFDPQLGATIHCESVGKRDRLSRRERAIVERLCAPAYERMRLLATSAAA